MPARPARGASPYGLAPRRIPREACCLTPAASAPLLAPGDLQRLRTLRELLDRFGCGLTDVAFARRLRAEPELDAALERWLEDRPTRPEGLSSSDWLSFEQEKHERLLAG